MRGFTDAVNQVFASRIREIGPPELTNVRLRGQITAIPGDPFLEILGVMIDTTNGAAFFDANGQPISKTQFFAAIAQGMQADVEEGTFDGVGIVTNATTTIEIED